MKFVVQLGRRLAIWHFNWRRKASVLDIGSTDFERIVRHLSQVGWKEAGRYSGIDAGIDYDCVRFRRGSARLKCEWDRLDDWSIEGSEEVVQELAAELGLHAVRQWRWARGDPDLSEPTREARAHAASRWSRTR